MLPRKLLVFLTLVSIVILAQACTSCNTHPPQDELTLADASVVWWMGPGIIAQKQNIYQRHGLNIKSFDVQTGLASKNAVLSGSADIGLVASAPLATGAFSKENLIVLCSYVESKSLLSVITPKANDNPLFSKPSPPIAIVKGTISEFYFYNYLTKTLQLQQNEIDELIKNELVVKPPDVVNAMKGSAKSAAIWEPFGTMIAAADSNLKVNRPEDIYTHRIYIVTTPAVLAKKRSAVERFVQSFAEACDFIKTDPSTAKERIKDVFPQQEQSMNSLWQKVDFSLKVDYDNMKALILEDGNILFHLGLTPKDSAGNARQLKPEDVQYLFNHDFKLTK
jgi:ABC-type nitrate/sulfonate/bicarbonate transport system substrate-binding protein